jgi:tRNA-2-methylthio-N6-dimethylallyladenosine synthase
MNQHDSERLSEVLRAAGYHSVDDPHAADVVLLNTCSVREKGEQKLRSEVGRLGLTKRDRPGMIIGVAGCVAQQEGEKLILRQPEIDLVLGPDNIAELPSMLREIELGGPPPVRTVHDVEQPRFLEARPELGTASVSAFVTVMKGCDERCSFCIVPYTRGPERYRPALEIVGEIQRLVDAGTREVTLLGQTVNSYRDPEGELARLGFAPAPALAIDWQHTTRARVREDESEFSALLRLISERVPGLLRLRYTSPHPRHLTPSLILAHRELDILARHVHLPFQSGSDRVLKRMIRRYDVAEYLERVETLREAVPGVTLSTDVIVGFPGETSEDFAATVALVEKVRFTGLFGFKYSPRPHTPALKLGDDVSEEEKSARLAELFAVSDAHRREHLHGLVGSEANVLVEGPGREGKGAEGLRRGPTYTGRTERNEIVHLAARRDVTGQILRVKVLEAFKNSLAAMPLDAELIPDGRYPAFEVAALPADELGESPMKARRALPVV